MDKSPVETTIEAIVKHIRSEEFKQTIENIRKLQAEEKKKEADQLKRKLPAFAPSGVFKGGHAKSQLERYNGVLLLDFDHVHPQLLEALLKLCRECEYTTACWATISGGIRVLVTTDGGEEDHLAAFLAVSAYYEQLLGIQCDPACK
ncbi:MAG: BT4734/BF3469 family protein, partial [Bacteroidales bacterium]|nr:BT4734/BF3469 family protein [Bacteroidales bacterium]